MKPIERGEVLGLAEYEGIRDRFRARVIDEKKLRRVKLGENASCVFENRDTVLMQIQEMLRTERITREAAVQHEIDTYNELVPKAHELSATILIEIEDKDTRETFLREAHGLEGTFALFIDGARCAGKQDARSTDARTTAVHYVKFQLPENAERALRDVLEKKREANEVRATLVCDHPKYAHEAALPPTLVASIAEDLA